MASTTARSGRSTSPRPTASEHPADAVGSGGLRAKLVAATAEIIGRDGPFAVRVEEVARLAGCSRATVYRHVPDKDALVREVLLGRTAALAAQLAAEIDDDGNPADWIVEGLLRHAEAVRAEPWFQALQRQGATAALARVGGGIEAVVGVAESLVAPFLARIDARGALRHDITVAEATEWLIGVHLGLLNPVFPHRTRAEMATMLRKFVAYALLAQPADS